MRPQDGPIICSLCNTGSASALADSPFPNLMMPVCLAAVPHATSRQSVISPQEQYNGRRDQHAYLRRQPVLQRD